jgi:hypothetical protein
MEQQVWEILEAFLLDLLFAKDDVGDKGGCLNIFLSFRLLTLSGSILLPTDFRKFLQEYFISKSER